MNQFKQCVSKSFVLRILVVGMTFSSAAAFCQSTPTQDGEVMGQQVISPHAAAAIRAKQSGQPIPQQDPALNEPPVFGRDYGLLQNPVSQPADGPISLMYFFEYDKPSALASPVVSAWRKTLGGDVLFNSSIASSGTLQEVFGARVFFALTLMNVEENLRPNLLKAIDDKKLDMSDPSSVNNWISNQGVDTKEFENKINSNQVIALATSSVDTSDEYEIQVVPSMVIDGKYWVRPRLDMTPVRFIQVCDFVLSMVRKDKKGAL